MRCIYCLQDSSSSTKQAHVVPQGFIQNDVVLPLGAECDECNERLGTLTTAFIHHNRIWGPIMVVGVRGKRGRPRGGLGYFTRQGDMLIVRVKVPRDKVKIDGGTLHVESPDPPQYDELKFRRELYHIALNYLAWKKGVEHLLESRYDPVRRYVRHANPGERWPYGQVMHPDEPIRKQLRISLVQEAPGETVCLRSFVDDFYVDALNTGQLRGWAKENLPSDHFFHE